MNSDRKAVDPVDRDDTYSKVKSEENRDPPDNLLSIEKSLEKRILKEVSDVVGPRKTPATGHAQPSVDPDDYDLDALRRLSSDEWVSRDRRDMSRDDARRAPRIQPKPAESASERAQNSVSPSPLKAVIERAEVMSDLRELSSTVPPPPGHRKTVDPLLQETPVGLVYGQSVVPLRRERSLLSVVAVAAAVGLFVIGAVFLGHELFSADKQAQSDNAEKSIAELQERYDTLIALLLSATPDSVAELESELEKTKLELALLREERRVKARDVSEQTDAKLEKRPDSAASKRSTRKKALPRRDTKDDTKGASSESPAVLTAILTSKTATPAPEKKRADDIDDLLGLAPPKPSTPDALPLPAASASQPIDSLLSSGSPQSETDHKTLTRADIRRGMKPVIAKVKKCGNGEDGKLVMSVTIAASGLVSHAVAEGAFAGSPIARCAAGAIGTARFPKTTQPTSIEYHFNL